MGLSLKLHRGEDFFVEDTRVTVREIYDDSSFIVQAEGGDPMRVTQDFAVELLPDVMLSASQKPEAGLAKIVVEAPRRITVLLGSLYRKPKPEAFDSYLFATGKPYGAHGRVS